jgi:hypothetical protein
MILKLSSRPVFLICFSALFITFFTAGISFSGGLAGGDDIVLNLEIGSDKGIQIIEKAPPSGGGDTEGGLPAGTIRPFILPQKLIISPSDGKISDFAASGSASFKLLDGLFLNDAHYFEAAGGAGRIALLLSDGKDDYIHFFKYDNILSAIKNAGSKTLVAGADNSCKISPAAYSKITGAGADKVYLLASPQARVDKYSADALSGVTEKLASAELDGYGAIFTTAPGGGGGGRVAALKASGGAVNTLISLGENLELLNSSIILSGDTRAVFIETALPDGIIVASASRYDSGGVLRRQFYSLDSFGRVCPLAELERFDYHRQALADDKNLYLLEAGGVKKDEKSGSVAAELKLHRIGREKIEKLVDDYYSRAASTPVNKWQSFSMAASDGRIHSAAVCPDGVGAFVFTGDGVYYNNNKLPVKLPAPDKSGPSADSSYGLFEAVFGGDGILYARREGESKVMKINTVAGGIADMETIDLKGFPPDAKLSGLSACRSSEIYLNDSDSLSMLKFGRDGLFAGKIPEAAFAVHGGFAQLFKAADGGGRDAPVKELVEYDGCGNFVRRVTGFAPPGGLPCGGTFCAGVDKKWRVFFMCFVPGSLLVRACDYRTGAVVKEASVKFSGVAGRMITPNYKVTSEGVIVFAAVDEGPAGRAKVTIYSIDIF